MNRSDLAVVKFPTNVVRALRRARFGIVIVAASYVAAVAAGMAMVHGGNGFALRYRDRLVAHANATSTISKELRENRAGAAAALDFGGNLTAGAASTAAGYWAPAVFPIALYRGWIGGIVSVDERHRSRLSTWEAGSYYVAVIVLQLLPYALAGGAGVNIGLARIRPLGDYAGAKILGIPKEALLDAARIYVLIVPLFAIASAYEFMINFG